MKRNVLLMIIIGSFLIIHQQIIAKSLVSSLVLEESKIIDSIYSETLDEHRDFWVKLPENYNPNNEEKYPVVYMLDGFSLKNSLETVYSNYWGHYLDLTTSQIKMRRGSAMDAETGGAENFTQFIERELIPHIDITYPTTPYRTLIGHSYAGLFTINMLINHGNLFENYIAIDPSIEWDNQKLLKEAKAKLETENFEGKSLFVSLAAEQLHMFNEEITMENIMEDSSEFTLFSRSIIEFSTFAASQKQSGLNFSWMVYPEDLHGTVPLPAIRDGLIFLFQWYQFKSPQKYNNPDTSVEELRELLKKQEAILSEHFGYPTPPMIEEMLNGYGYMNMQMGQPEKAYLFFKMNIDYYPNSANAYDSMADYYQSQNDNASALKYATKAFELSGTDYYKNRMEEFKIEK
jgi:predicted alpha/beta superfamily hydrolase